MAEILIYSDKTGYTLELLSAASIIAKDLGASIKVISINDAEQAKLLSKKGAEVYEIDNAAISLADPAVVSEAIKQAAEKLSANIVLVSSNRRGKEIAGRIAQKMDAGCLTDVNSVSVSGGEIQCVRNALGGATVATQAIKTKTQVIAIVPKSFPPAGDGQGSVLGLTVDVTPTVKLVDTRMKAGDSVDIEAAEVLVAVGMGLEDQNDLEVVEAIAKTLGGEVGCSKPVATDKKWFSEERIIGLSGKKCKPELAILMGISGQVQFVVGIRDAKTIVAINKDENANLMKMADYVLVADIKEVLPQLTSILK